MNANEFKNWLEGFLEGKSELSKSNFKILKDKLESITKVTDIFYTPNQIIDLYTPPPFSETPYSIMCTSSTLDNNKDNNEKNK